MRATGNTAADPKQTMREQWGGAAAMWRKWNDKFVAQTRAATELVVETAQVQPGMRVLDLASGTGEPALSLARAVELEGHAVATDLVPEMLATAQQKAEAQGLSNMEFRVTDAENLPFPDAAFDRVTCRFGLMFFPNVQKALAGIHRVLKPGERATFLVCGTYDESPWFLREIAKIAHFMQYFSDL